MFAESAGSLFARLVYLRRLWLVARTCLTHVQFCVAHHMKLGLQQQTEGPYLYSLFSDRGLRILAWWTWMFGKWSKIWSLARGSNLIAKLFAVGFISAAALGSVAGRICDKIGKRRGCLLYCAGASDEQTGVYVVRALWQICGILRQFVVRLASWCTACQLPFW